MKIQIDEYDLRSVLEKLETAYCNDPDWHDGYYKEAITICEQALSEPEMAPAFRSSHAYTVGFHDGKAQALTEQPAQHQEPYGWKVDGVNALYRGEFAEHDAKAEAKRIGGTCTAFPLYTSKPASKPLTDESIKIMREVLEVQGRHGNWNYDSYMHGLYNGMEYMLALAENREPQFRDAPETWLAKYEVKRNNFSNTEELAEQPANQLDDIDVVDIPAQQQEPFAWLCRDSWGGLNLSQIMPPPVGAFPVYTSPPASKPWVELTDEKTVFIGQLVKLVVLECMGVVSSKCASRTAYNALAEHFGVQG